jgi:radical SAM protein with 4Fe4S-binding SPASM domain
MSDSPVEQVSLRQVHLHLTDGCSLACRHCWIQPIVNGGNGKGTHFLPLLLGLQAVREAIPLGLRSVRLNGGDSLFHPELDALLDQLESLEVAVQVETNGAGLTPQRANRLARLPQSTVYIPLDGADALTHDAYATRPGSFEYATRAVRILASAGLAVQVVFSVRRGNVTQIPALVRLVEELGGESIRFVLLQPEVVHLPKNGKGNGNGNHNGKANGNGNGHHANGNAFQEIKFPYPDVLRVEELIALSWRVERELAHTTRIHLVFDQPPAFRGLHPKARVESQERCGILNSLSVTPEGEYTLCGLSQKLPGMALGNAGEASLAEIWAGHPTLQLLRAGLPNRLQGVCERCTMKQSCMGSCVIENKLRTGSFWGPGWFCEAAERVGLFPAGRLIENTW